ncbi:MAG: hypothetical protein MRK02_15640 [Candidatus Scalindua sp.]|nr:hypothetical protein [Candidatus Scalindua sp.]
MIKNYLVKNYLCICFISLAISVPVFAFDKSPENEVETSLEVDKKQVLEDIYALVDIDNAKLFQQKNNEVDELINDLFTVTIPRSKLEQFYTMLFYISKYASIEKDVINIDRDSTIKLLISSRVFSDPEFPKRISSVYLSRLNREIPYYKVSFDSELIELNLNKGDGYGISREGMHQQAQSLVFYGSFSFSLRKKKDNVEAFDFDDVDLYGSFGSRGYINVDINYVAIKSVEFHKGTEMALVKAKVSRREFETNKHTWLLSLVTRFVNDKSLQPIDW